jgi:hypothetical protein
MFIITALSAKLGKAVRSVVVVCGAIAAVALVSAPAASAGTALLTTINLPAGSLPTGVAIDTNNHIAYVAESGASAIAKITGSNSTTAGGIGTPTNITFFSGLNFPTNLAFDNDGVSADRLLYATNFCVGTQFNVCSSQPSGTTTVLHNQTGASSGQANQSAGCSFPLGVAVVDHTSHSIRVIYACGGSPTGSPNAGSVAECTPGSPGGPFSSCPQDAIIAYGGTKPVPSGAAVNYGTGSTSDDRSAVVADAHNSKLNIFNYNGSNFGAETAISLTTGCTPAMVAVKNNGNTGSSVSAVLVACPGTGTVEVGAVNNLTLLRANGSGCPGTGDCFTPVALPSGTNTPAPYGVAVRGTTVVVTDSANNRAIVYTLSGSGTTASPFSLTSPTAVNVGSVPDGVALDTNSGGGTNAFVTNEFGASVSVIDPADGTPVPPSKLKRHHKPGHNHKPAGNPLVAPPPAQAVFDRGDVFQLGHHG